MKTFGIIGAMEQEVKDLKSKMKIDRVVEIAGLQCFVGVLAGKNAVLAECGIGKVNAAICAQAMIDLCGVTHIINTGVAGAISNELNVGDVVISKDLVQHDFDTTATGDILGEIPRIGTGSFAADLELISAAKQAGEAVLGDKHKVFIERIATGDQFIAGREQKQKIADNFAAACAEMEGAAIAQTCYLNKIPFVVIRAISDKADGGASLSFEEFVSFAAKNSSLIVEGILN